VRQDPRTAAAQFKAEQENMSHRSQRDVHAAKDFSIVLRQEFARCFPTIWQALEAVPRR
jgi:molecular chaperone GrpE (heat shock protein)